jgi:nicotinamide riboside transporter PnuC
MSVEASPRYEDYDESLTGYGWVVFAGVLLLIVGTVNFIEGVAAIGNAHFFSSSAHYVFGDLKTWGWVALIIGVIQVLAGLGVFLKNQLARWVGVGILLLNAIAQLLMIQAYPFWALSVFAVDVIAVYGLIAYGRLIGED